MEQLSTRERILIFLEKLINDWISEKAWLVNGEENVKEAKKIKEEIEKTKEGK